MFSKLAIVAVASLAAFTIATPIPGGEPGTSCSTGPVQCCNTVQEATSAFQTYGHILGLLVGAQADDFKGLVGIACLPVTVIGGTANSCKAQAVCCQNNNFNGALVAGCNPVAVA